MELLVDLPEGFSKETRPIHLQMSEGRIFLACWNAVVDYAHVCTYLWDVYLQWIYLIYACMCNEQITSSKHKDTRKINNDLSGPLQDLVAPLEMAVLCSVATLWLLKFCVPGRG